MKITKIIIAAFMVAGLIGIAGCDSAVEEPAGGPDPMEIGTEMEETIGEMGEDPGEEAEEAAEEAEEAEGEGEG
ncbi:MAG TPA: hypothetical protein EYM79_05565 [Planctomycetes bacterium]|nr:hypothetical protein [Planctomycetaceae bacterium]HIN53762.1 hypothetical protein [Planctomycetota bacterium]